MQRKSNTKSKSNRLMMGTHTYPAGMCQVELQSSVGHLDIHRECPHDAIVEVLPHAPRDLGILHRRIYREVIFPIFLVLRRRHGHINSVSLNGRLKHDPQAILDSCISLGVSELEDRRSQDRRWRSCEGAKVNHHQRSVAVWTWMTGVCLSRTIVLTPQDLSDVADQAVSRWVLILP